MNTIANSYGLSFFLTSNTSADASANRALSRAHRINAPETGNGDTPVLTISHADALGSLVHRVNRMGIQGVNQAYLEHALSGYGSNASGADAQTGIDNTPQTSSKKATRQPASDGADHVLTAAEFSGYLSKVSGYISGSLELYNFIKNQYDPEYLGMLKRDLGEKATQDLLDERDAHLKRISDDIQAKVDSLDDQFHPSKPFAELIDQDWVRNDVTITMPIGGAPATFAMDKQGIVTMSK